MDIVDLLIQFNLTRQEALIYTTLFTDGELSGYEIAKKTGISRSNTYTSLASLVDKGAAYLIEEKVKKYTAISIEEFCDNKINNLKRTKDEILEFMPDKRNETDGYITIKGKHNILDKMRNMISEANERIYISVSESVLKNVTSELEKAIANGKKIVVITNGLIAFEGATEYISKIPPHQIRLIVDSTNVLTGDIREGENSTCLYSKKKNLVEIFKDSLKNEIKLIEIMKGKG